MTRAGCPVSCLTTRACTPRCPLRPAGGRPCPRAPSPCLSPPPAWAAPAAMASQGTAAARCPSLALRAARASWRPTWRARACSQRQPSTCSPPRTPTCRSWRWLPAQAGPRFLRRWPAAGAVPTGAAAPLASRCCLARSSSSSSSRPARLASSTRCQRCQQWVWRAEAPPCAAAMRLWARWVLGCLRAWVRTPGATPCGCRAHRKSRACARLRPRSQTWWPALGAAPTAAPPPPWQLPMAGCLGWPPAAAAPATTRRRRPQAHGPAPSTLGACPPSRPATTPAPCPP
mmetsp:Transcript_7791/g.19357  ORF Transcript_7791/g.19357 Transcript_7791/m.19357 type:complete len:287 (+) Transcript_7791:1354-2214(+)